MSEGHNLNFQARILFDNQDTGILIFGFFLTVHLYFSTYSICLVIAFSVLNSNLLTFLLNLSTPL